MRKYKSELGNHPFLRSEENMKTLAIFRGVSSEFEFSENLNTIKEI